MEKKNKKKFLLILDLDGTLVDDRLEITTDSKIPIRPGWTELKSTCKKHDIQLAIWSASGSERVQMIAKKLDYPFRDWEFIWDGSRCTWQFPTYSYYTSQYGRIPRKRLSKIWRRKKVHGWTKYNTWILDNTPSTYIQNYGNAIPIQTWEGSSEDKELYRISQCLDDLMVNSINDVRLLTRYFTSDLEFDE